MAKTEACETCGGDQVLIGDTADVRGERTDDVQACPDCTVIDFEDLDDEVPEEIVSSFAYLDGAL